MTATEREVAATEGHGGFTGSPAQLWLSTLARLVLGAILVYASLAKLVEPSAAVRAVNAYQLLPPSWGEVVGYGLPLLELVLGVLLVLGLATRWAAIGTAVLMVGFIAAVTSAWARGLSIDCGCFGGGGEVDPAGKEWRYLSEILRDLLFLGLATWLIRWPASRLSLDGHRQLDGVPDEHGHLDEHLDDHAGDQPDDHLDPTPSDEEITR